MKQRFVCEACSHSWSLGGVRYGNPSVTKLERLVVRESLERASMRILKRRFGKSKRWIMETVHRVTSLLPGSEWVAKRFRPKWSGILCVDGKMVRVFDRLEPMLAENSSFTERQRKMMHWKVWLCGIDSGTGDLPHYELADEETRVDLIIFFQKLKENGYELRVLVSDGNEDISHAARKVFGEDVLIQRCTRHFVEGLRRKASDAGLDGEKRTVELIGRIQSIIEADDIVKAGARLDALKRKRFHHPFHRTVIEEFKALADILTTHLQYPDLQIPHTTNEIENVFKQVEMRLGSLCRFQHWTYARDYLKAWALLRRFTPFTDCRGERKNRNKRSPLELAGCDVSSVDPVNPPN